MKAYVLIGFIVLVILALSLLPRRETLSAQDMAQVSAVRNRIVAMEAKIAESNAKRAEGEGTLNSTLR
jgi:hypothetical protein